VLSTFLKVEEQKIALAAESAIEKSSSAAQLSASSESRGASPPAKARSNSRMSKALRQQQSAEAFERFLDSFPTCVPPGQHAHWDDVLYVTNFVQTFKNLLSVGTHDLDSFSKAIAELDPATISAAAEAEAAEMEAISRGSSGAGGKGEGEGDDEPCDEEEMEIESAAALAAAERVAATERGQMAAEAALDRLQLNMMQFVLRGLHVLLDLSDDPNCRLPLNQLTWQELARMSVNARLMEEAGRGREDVLHAVRGSKASGFRTAKNVVRAVRYRLAFRQQLEAGAAGSVSASLHWAPNDGRLPVASAVSSSGEGALSLSETTQKAEAEAEDVSLGHRLSVARGEAKALVVSEGSPLGGLLGNQEESIMADLSSEQALEVALERAAADPELPGGEGYRRCCKVLVKLVRTSQAKYLLWEVDQESYPDYYDAILRPGALCGVAAKLLDHGYEGELPSDPSTHTLAVARCFYRDVRQVRISSIMSLACCSFCSGCMFYAFFLYGSRYLFCARVFSLFSFLFSLFSFFFLLCSFLFSQLTLGHNFLAFFGSCVCRRHPHVTHILVSFCCVCRFSFPNAFSESEPRCS
jgi:hypothetical protein